MEACSEIHMAEKGKKNQRCGLTSEDNVLYVVLGDLLQDTVHQCRRAITSILAEMTRTVGDGIAKVGG